MKNKDIVLENVSMSGIVKWLTDNHKHKKTGTQFTISDVQGYMRRGNLPPYLGGHKIILVKNEYSKGLYNIVKNKS